MAKEIERKFLVKDLHFLKGIEGEFFRQGYLPSKNLTTLRVRVAGARAFLTVKGANQGITRVEFEYAIPVDDANKMLETLCEKPFIEKYRYKIKQGRVCWGGRSFLWGK
jgi:adenylate cyclase